VQVGESEAHDSEPTVPFRASLSPPPVLDGFAPEEATHGRHHHVLLGAHRPRPRHEGARGARPRGPQARQERGQIDELLAACGEETLDAGPYALGESGKLDLGKVLQGDRFFALLMVRALTYGPEYAFGVSCRNDNCRARIDWEIDLTKLPVRKLSEESRAAFVAGIRFETTLPDAGKRVTFKLLIGEDERKLPAVQRAALDKLLSAVLAYRVLDIDGVEPPSRSSAPSASRRRRWTSLSTRGSSCRAGTGRRGGRPGAALPPRDWHFLARKYILIRK
jgi:hypothetical protein